MNPTGPDDVPPWLKNPLLIPPSPSSSAADASSSADALIRALQTATLSTPTVPKKSAAEELLGHLVFGRKVLSKKPMDKGAVVMFLRRIRAALVQVFGPQSVICKALDEEISLALKNPLTAFQFGKKLNEVETLTRCLNSLSQSELSILGSEPARHPINDNVFIVHGHDELNTRRLEKLLQVEFKLNPIVMMSKAGQSRPLTDKFEDNAKICSFAFALFTPDDQVQSKAGAYSQARPNVVYEAGWFVGRLGKSRVVLLLKRGTQIHSDLHGVSQIHFVEDIQDKFLDIQRELQAAGLIESDRS